MKTTNGALLDELPIPPKMEEVGTEVMHNRPKYGKIDKRDLINIDLYDHEIKVMCDQLNKVAEKHKGSRKIHKRSELYKEKLNSQKTKLERLGEHCRLKDMESLKETTAQLNKNEEFNNLGFFARLKSFEDTFKDIRYKVNDFVNQWQ